MAMKTSHQSAQLRNALRNLKTTKFAALGGEPGAAFESSFASLAYVYIQDKAPALLDHMVGFQLVENNEENTKAIGVFGFKLGPSWLYIPVFWLNGDIKGHELLYLKKQDVFVPLKENWVNYVMRQQPSETGMGVGGDPRQLGLAQPDLQTLKTPPDSVKFGSWEPKVGIRPWAKDAVNKIASWAFTPPSEHGKPKADLKSALSSDLSLASAAVKYSSVCPALAAGFDQFYGPNFLRDCLLTLKEKVASEAPKAKPKRAAVKSAVDGLSKVEVISEQDARRGNIADIPGLSDADKAKLLRDGYLVRDNREGDEVSRAYNYSITNQFTNPSETGVYDVLLRDDNFERCLVIVNPRGEDCVKKFSTVVRLSDKSYKNYPTKDVYVRMHTGASDAQTEYRTWLDGLADSRSLQEDACYVIVTSDGKGTTPFTVRADHGDNNYDAYFEDYSPGCGGIYPFDNSARIESISLSVRRGSDFVVIAQRLLVPPTAKIFKLSEPPACRKCKSTRLDCTCSYFEEERNKKMPINLGSIAELQLQLFQKTAELKLWHDANELVVNRGRMSKKAGLFHLIKDHGFTERDAIKLIKESEKRGGAKYRVKYAAPYPNQFEALQGPGMPYFPEMGQEGFSRSMGVMTNVPDEQDVVIDDLAAEQETDDPFGNMAPQQVAQLASQAAQTGQKEVFDTAVIGSLVNAVRQDSIIDRYLQDLTTGLDRLGRLLFMFYWHNDEFSDRFGKSDMPELEDSLRNAFEGTGDLVLYLKQKNVNTFDIAGGFGEPNLEAGAN